MLFPGVFFSNKALQHDTTHLHYRRRSFSFLWEWGWEEEYVSICRGEKEKGVSYRWTDVGEISPKTLIIKIVQKSSLVHRIDFPLVLSNFAPRLAGVRFAFESTVAT